LVSSGDIRVFAWGESGREISLYHVTDGHTCLVNLLCAYLNSPSPASAQAETRVEAWIVPAERFRQWVRNDPALVDHVFAAMADRVVDLMTLVEEISFRRMDERLSVYLAGQFGKDGNVPRACTATHEQIAAELGTAREVISRLLKDFERRGAVRTGRGRIELMNEAQLARSSSAVADRSD
jgi:CRP/FNR family transcriptional regulator